MKAILILGGYGNFGQRIATALVKDHFKIIIAGRDQQKAQALQRQLSQITPENNIQIAVFDAEKNLAQQLELLKPGVVINTIGPFQTADYSIAQICIEQKMHYIDLADGRDFVANIVTLDADAQNNKVSVISGASTIPGLSSAVLEHFKPKFKKIDSLIYGISLSQKAPRGLATTESLLSYLGKPLKPWDKNNQHRFGFQHTYKQAYPELGHRWMGICDIPDLDLFGPKYGLTNTQFSVGMESTLLHFGILAMSYLIRAGLPLNLIHYAKPLLAFSHCFDIFGSKNGGMHMVLQGSDHNNNPLTIKWFIIAKNNEGPQIPCVPAIMLSKKIIRGEFNTVGAIPCLGLITLEEYLSELQGFDIKTYVQRPSSGY